MLWCVVGIDGIFFLMSHSWDQSTFLTTSYLTGIKSIMLRADVAPAIVLPTNSAIINLPAPTRVLCLSGLGIALLPEGRHHEAGLASESQHQQQPVCLHEGESSQDQPSASHSTAELRMRRQNRGFAAQLRGRGSSCDPSHCVVKHFT